MEWDTAAEWLRATGPYGPVVVLSWALWKINERKDAALAEMYERIAEMAEKQTAAITGVKGALEALREAIQDLRREER